MSANIESIAWTGEKPWHGLGTEVKGLMTAKEAIVAGGLDWQVNLRPLFVDGALNIDTGLATQHEVERYRAVVRNTDNKTLGVVGGRYNPVQNIECFDFFDALTSMGLAKYEVVGALDGGRRVWLLARVEGDITINNPRLADDRIQRYMMLSNTHDGSGNLRAFFTDIRTVCANTERMALKAAGTDGITIRHTKNAQQKMKEAARIADVIKEHTAQFVEACNTLANTSFSTDQMRKLTEVLFPGTGETLSTRTLGNRNTLLNLFTNGRGNFGESAWDAYNAVTEYVDHERGTRLTGDKSESEARWTSSLFGSGGNMKDNALDAIYTILNGEA